MVEKEFLAILWGVDIPQENPAQCVDFQCGPWKQISIDIKGPDMDSRLRPIYIIVMVDYFTKIVHANATTIISTKDTTAVLNGTFATLG